MRTDSVEYQLTTEDFVRAAHQLRPLHEHHQGTQDREYVQPLEQALVSAVDKSISRHGLGGQKRHQLLPVED